MEQSLKNIPKQLKNLNGDWINWHYEQRQGKEKTYKVPEVPKDWYDKPQLSFDEAVKRSTPNKGIGIAFRRSNNLVGIDLDNIKDNAIPTKIKAILSIAKTGGYIERSISKTGFHIIGECSYKQQLLQLLQQYTDKGTSIKSKDRLMELYAKDRYFTVSGFTLYNNWNNIDMAIALAWEYITGTTILKSIATLYGDIAPGTERSDESAPIQSVAANTTPKTPPGNAFTDDDVATLKLRPINDVINKMFEKRPILKRIIEKDGYNAASEYWNLYGKKTKIKDTSPSGFDMEIASALTFWLYRYGADAVAEILQKSKVNRKKMDNYWIVTAQKAHDRQIEYFAATYALPKDQQTKLQNWMKWKKDIAKEQEPA